MKFNISKGNLVPATDAPQRQPVDDMVIPPLPPSPQQPIYHEEAHAQPRPVPIPQQTMEQQTYDEMERIYHEQRASQESEARRQMAMRQQQQQQVPQPPKGIQIFLQMSNGSQIEIGVSVEGAEEFISILRRAMEKGDIIQIENRFINGSQIASFMIE